MTTAVLICDDSNLARKQLARILPQEWQNQLFFAGHGGEALEIPVSGSFRIEEADAAIESVATAAGAKFERLPGGFIIIH